MIQENPPFVGSGKKAILIAGSIDPIGPLIKVTKDGVVTRWSTTMDTMERNDLGEVVVFDDVRSFTVTAVFPVAHAKRIKVIIGNYVEGALQLLSTRGEPQKLSCTIEP